MSFRMKVRGKEEKDGQISFNSEYCFNNSRGTLYAREPQTPDPHESGLMLEQHSWCRYFVLI